MAETSMNWITLSFVVLAVGLLLNMFGLAGAGRDLTGVRGVVEASQILGFLCLLTAFILGTMSQYGEMANHVTEVQMANVAFSYMTVLCVIVGIGIYAACTTHKRPPAYPCAMLITSALLATLGGTFSLLHVLEY